jgi:hypothetical protein
MGDLLPGSDYLLKEQESVWQAHPSDNGDAQTAQETDPEQNLQRNPNRRPCLPHRAHEECRQSDSGNLTEITDHGKQTASQAYFRFGRGAHDFGVIGGMEESHTDPEQDKL